MKNFKQIFTSPATESRPWILWIWNHAVDRTIVKNQLDTLLSAGIGGILVRPGRDLMPTYLSEEFFTLFGMVLEAAKKQGVGVRIADDFSLPWSGCFDTMLNRSEALRAQSLVLTDLRICHEGETVDYSTDAPRDTVVLAAKIKNGQASLTEVRSLPLPADKPLSWKVPQGEWGIFILHKKFVRDLAGGYLPNVFNPRSAQIYIQEVLNVFKTRFSKYVGTTFKGFLTEMPAYGPGGDAIPWDDELVTKFRTKYKKELLKLLPSLFHDAPGAARTRNQLYGYFSHSMYERFAVPLDQWGRKNRLSQWVLAPEHALTAGSNPLVDADFHTDKELAAVGLQNIEGMEENFALLRGMSDSNTNEYRRATVAVIGRNKTGVGATLQSLKNEIDLQLMAGATHLIIDGAFLAFDQRSSLKTPHNPLWYPSLGGSLRNLCDYTARMHEVIRGLVPARPVAIYSPAGAIRATFKPQNGETARFGKELLQKTVDAVLQQNLDFDIVSEEQCVSCTVRVSGEFGKGDRKGKASYRVLVVPYAPLVSRSFLVFLEKLVAQRGTVVFVNEPPRGTFEDGINSLVTKRIERLTSTKRSGSRVVAIDDLENRLGDVAGRMRIKSNNEKIPDLVCMNAADQGSTLYWIHNRSDRQEFSLSIDVPQERHLVAVDCASCSSTEITDVTREGGRSRFNLHLLPQTTYLIVGTSSAASLHPARPAKGGVFSASSRSYRIILKNQWSFEAVTPNALPLANWNLRIGLSRESGGFAHFYESSFQVGTLPEECWLAPGKLTGSREKQRGAEGQVEISINGTRIDRPVPSATDSDAPGTSVAPSFLVPSDRLDTRSLFGIPATVYDISGLLTKGFNRIAVRSTGTVADPQTILYPYFILGQFSIMRGQNGWVIERNSAAISADSWTRYGYPYLSGKGVYHQLFEVPHQYNRLILRLSRVSGIVDIRINGKPVTKFLWQPMSVDITNFCESKRNELAITVSNTQDNLLRLNGRPSGILGDVYLDVL